MAASAAPRATGRASTASSPRCSTLEDDQTLLVQSGKPVGVFRTHADAPRVLIANSNLVPHWATWEHFNELDRKGLAMYGQMTAGSWIYIGAQGIVQGTYETFVEMGRQHFGGSLEGQVDPHRRAGRHGRRAAAGRHHGRGVAAWRWSAGPAASSCACAPAISTRRPPSLDEALLMIEQSCAEGKPVSVGLLGNTAEVLPELVQRGVRPDMRDRPDLGARSDQRLPAARLDAGRMGGPPRRRSRRAWPRRRRHRWRCM